MVQMCIIWQFLKKSKQHKPFESKKNAKEAVLTVKTMKKSAWKKLAYVV